MKFVADPELAEWLATGPAFEWDKGNRAKTAKHHLTPSDVDTIARIVFVGRIIEPTHDEPRGLLLGTLASGRQVTLIFTRRGELLRPISCRAMRDNEREFYEAQDA